MRTSGRKIRLTRTTKAVASAACSGWPLPANTYRRRAPQGGRGIQPGDLQSLAKDDACAEKADPGDDLRCHARRAVLARIQTGEDHKTRRPDRDQRIGAQACHPLTPLAFESDACAHEGGHAEADGSLINRCVHGEIPVRVTGAFAGGAEPTMPCTASAIAPLIRQFEDGCVKNPGSPASATGASPSACQRHSSRPPRSNQ